MNNKMPMDINEAMDIVIPIDICIQNIQQTLKNERTKNCAKSLFFY